MKNTIVKIRRGEELRQYIVETDSNMSVMDVLEKIYNTQDNTLSFFRHEACHQEACGKCLVKVNGKVRLACGTDAGQDELLLEPYSDNVVKDLICEVRP